MPSKNKTSIDWKQIQDHQRHIQKSKSQQSQIYKQIRDQHDVIQHRPDSCGDSSRLIVELNNKGAIIPSKCINESDFRHLQNSINRCVSQGILPSRDQMAVYVRQRKTPETLMAKRLLTQNVRPMFNWMLMPIDSPVKQRFYDIEVPKRHLCISRFDERIVGLLVSIELKLRGYKTKLIQNEHTGNYTVRVLPIHS